MDVPSIAAIVAMVLVALWYVLRPLLQADVPVETEVTPDTNNQLLEELRHRRDATYAAIKDLELDLAAEKISQVDYRQMRTRLTQQAAEILKEIDQLDRRGDEALDIQIDQLLAEFQAGAAKPDPALRAQVLRQIKDSLEEPAQPVAQKRGCPKCGHTVGPDDIFCSRCGSALSSRCPNCQTQVSVGDQFCASCGTGLTLDLPATVEAIE